MEFIIGDEYNIKFAGSIILVKYINTYITYGNLQIYLFKDTTTYYTIQLNQIIKKTN
jgi:hypothetical protein